MKRCLPCQLATVCVPWDNAGEFREDIFRREIRQLRECGFDNLYIFGTAGEGYAVTNDYFRRIAKVFGEETPDLAGLRQVGIIGLSSMQVRERIEIGLELGFTQFQVSFPAWGVLSDVEISTFFTEVFSPYPEATFLHYNTPRGGRVLRGDDYARLALCHDNLVATKSGGHTAATLQSLLNSAPELCHFFVERDYAVASLLGLECGLLVSVSAMHPALSTEFYQAGINADRDKLLNMNTQLNVICETVIKMVSGTGCHMDGAFDKIYCRLLDPDFPLNLTSPYKGCTEKTFNEILDWLKNHYPQWVHKEKDHK